MFTDEEKFSVYYHDLFDYPLSFSDLIKWSSNKTLHDYSDQKINVVHKNGFYFLEGREGLVYKRLLRKRISLKKGKIAKKAAKLLSIIPGIKMIAQTGSLAMENSSEESDIDLMIITKRGFLWTTRLFAYFIIRLFGIRVRNPGVGDQKNKLCLNIWLDEADLSWPKKNRNIYTAHEIAQATPLVNKNKTYEIFLSQNKWILSYWPKAVRIKNLKSTCSTGRINLVEKLAFKLQYLYMKNKISEETITTTRALFHPRDWAKIIMNRLSS